MIRRWVRDVRNRRVFSGNYASWADARAASAGYDDAAVLEKVVAATRKVVTGHAAWDRDGVAFMQPEVNGDLMTALRDIAAVGGGKMDLVDFGGALGSTWRQHRAALAGLARVRWSVVEQPHYVAAGREFADDVLTFHPTLDAAWADGTGAAVLFSGVLQYVEQPAALLAEAVRLRASHIVIDRTSFAANGRQRIVVQRPPADLGGEYPCWLFERQQFLAPLAIHYQLRREWLALDRFPRVTFRGFHFERRS